MSQSPGSGQLPLALRFPPDQRFDTYVGAQPQALPQLQALAEGAIATCVFIAGARGSGKSHLALATCAQAQAMGRAVHYLPLASAAGRMGDALDALHAFDLVALDGVHEVAGMREDEIALFDFHNRMHDAGKPILYTARCWADELPLVLPDLRSRLAQCTRIALLPLDDDGRAQVLRLRAQRRGLELDAAAVDWLLRRTDRDLSSLAALLDRLDRASLAAQRRITVPFLRQTLGDAT